MKTKPLLKKHGGEVAVPVVVLDGVKVRILRHPGKGKIPLKTWREAVKAVNATRPGHGTMAAKAHG